MDKTFVNKKLLNWGAFYLSNLPIFKEQIKLNMKAIICSEYGLPNTLEYKEVDDPKPNKWELLISIKACSVNFPDTLIIQGLYQYKPEPPFSPGSDIAGIVEEVGEGVKGFTIGDEIVGFNPYGGFAEKVTVQARDCFPKPKGMSMVNASAFLMAYGTSYHALKDRGEVQEGDSVLVLGAAGGVGITAVELAKLIFNEIEKREIDPVAVTLSQVKSEIREIF